MRRGLKVRFRVLFPPDTVVPFTSTLPSFIHTSPTTAFTVHNSEYTYPATELPDDEAIGKRAEGKRYSKEHQRTCMHLIHGTTEWQAHEFL